MLFTSRCICIFTYSGIYKYLSILKTERQKGRVREGGGNKGRYFSMAYFNNIRTRHTETNAKYTKEAQNLQEKNNKKKMHNVTLETICNNPLVWLLTSRVDHLLVESKKRLHNSMKLYGEDLALESNLKTICKGRTSQLLCCVLCLFRAWKT